jgi:hypothetical protein
MVLSLLGSLRPGRSANEVAPETAPREFDVVRFLRPVDGWPAGTRATIIDALSDTHGLVEISAVDRDGLETAVVPYSAVEVVWAHVEHECPSPNIV